jgi:hypothetical protein
MSKSVRAGPNQMRRPFRRRCRRRTPITNPGLSGRPIGSINSEHAPEDSANRGKIHWTVQRSLVALDLPDALLVTHPSQPLWSEIGVWLYVRKCSRTRRLLAATPTTNDEREAARRGRKCVRDCSVGGSRLPAGQLLGPPWRPLQLVVRSKAFELSRIAVSPGRPVQPQAATTGVCKLSHVHRPGHVGVAMTEEERDLIPSGRRCSVSDPPPPTRRRRPIR